VRFVHSLFKILDAIDQQKTVLRFIDQLTGTGQILISEGRVPDFLTRCVELMYHLEAILMKQSNQSIVVDHIDVFVVLLNLEQLATSDLTVKVDCVIF
jgi:hypothetical protein